MEINIVKNEKQPLLKRSSVTAEARFEGATAARSLLREELAKKLKMPADRLIVRHIAAQYGKRTAIITAYVYDDQETITRLESNRVRDRHGMIKKAEAPKTEA